MNTSLRFIAAAVLLALVSTPVLAQGLGKRPVRVLVASPPGGPSDVQIRLLVPRMSELLGQTLIVDNRPSNNGVVASEIASKAVPDGLTLAVGNSGTHAVNATLYAHLPYDPVRDFAPISQFSTTGLVVAANPRLPGRSVQDLVAFAKDRPGKLNVAVAGATGELAGDALWVRLHLKMTNVRYKGSAPSELSVVSGETDLSLLTPLATLNHLQSGRLKVYGITSLQRSPVLPDVPTFAEQGVQGFEIQFWNGLFAPAGTSVRIVRAMSNAVVYALAAPEVRERFKQLGLVIVGNTPEQFAAVVKRDVDQFRKIIIDSGIERL
jgi:tripartite-type tricarboxylate transporter receptor subunit TctC